MDPIADNVAVAFARLPAGHGQRMFTSALEDGIDAVPDAPDALRALFAQIDRVRPVILHLHDEPDIVRLCGRARAPASHAQSRVNNPEDAGRTNIQACTEMPSVSIQLALNDA